MQHWTHKWSSLINSKVKLRPDPILGPADHLHLGTRFLTFAETLELNLLLGFSGRGFPRIRYAY